MANTTLFSSITSLFTRTDTSNEAGGRAYALTPKHALSQLAATGCFNGVFYTDAQKQLDTLRALVESVGDNTFLAKLAVYAREKAYMKDMPAALLLMLAKRDTTLMHRIFDRVIDNGRVLRTMFQMLRSGQFGKSGLSSSLQRAFQRWLNEASVGTLLSASIGNKPSLRDVFRMARPTPKDNERRALFGWLSNKPVEKWAPATRDDLPTQLQRLIAYRLATTAEEQVRILDDLSVRWDLLADAALSPEVWKAIAKKMGPQALRMNINTLHRHEVLNDPTMVEYVAERIGNRDEVLRSRQFPYQYLAAYLNASAEVPTSIREALNVAAELACGNIPELPGPVIVGVDTSGSMQSPVTGNRGSGATTAMRCVDVAALFAAAILRRSPESVIVPFDTSAHKMGIESSDTILSLSEKLAKLGGGGTDCSIPLKEANNTLQERQFAGIVLVSDNESWVATGRYGSTALLTEWQTFAKRQKGFGVVSPKLICIDIQPYGTTQAPERDDILNIGGFSDAVFNVVSGFLSNEVNRFVDAVEAIEL